MTGMYVGEHNYWQASRISITLYDQQKRVSGVIAKEV